MTDIIRNILIILAIALIAVGLLNIGLVALSFIKMIDGLSQGFLGVAQLSWALGSAAMALAVADIIHPLRNLGRDGLFIFLIIGLISSVFSIFGSFSFAWAMFNMEIGIGDGMIEKLQLLSNVGGNVLGSFASVFIFAGFVVHNRNGERY